MAAGTGAGPTGAAAPSADPRAAAMGLAGETARTQLDDEAGADGAFGFDVQEQRRYVLGPEEALRAGESASWRIRLDRVEGEDDARRATFVLEHTRDEYLSNIFWDTGRVLRVMVEAELTVNSHGFPLHLVLREQQDMGGEGGSQSASRTTSYELEGEQYVKTVRLSGRDWSFDVPIANHEHLDVDARAGLFLFLSSGLRCLGEYVDGSSRSGTRDTGDFRSCDTIEPAFANPGLMSLVMPEVWEDDDGDRDVLFFQPLGVGTIPAGLMNITAWVRDERDGFASLRRYYEHGRIELEELAEVEVGPRSFEAWRVSVSGTLRDVWVDHQGRVLRSDIDPHPRTGRDRFIRLQFPSEY